MFVRRINSINILKLNKCFKKFLSIKINLIKPIKNIYNKNHNKNLLSNKNFKPNSKNNNKILCFKNGNNDFNDSPGQELAVMLMASFFILMPILIYHKD